ncbi:MAG: (2Fe-2S)-binding protein [Bryobacteraceae bacterium]|nr:(2Fe-2S)-binding protein [Bryobacteraceae bacterium]MDW8376635.1 (2Fe-2S)-binding protein [Bryobacterales bacterium]
MKFQLRVNGHLREIDTDPRRPLLDVLREDLHLTGAKYGCGEGQCRACTVLVEGQARPSCLLPVRAAAGLRVTTIEGLAPDGRLSAVQQAFVEESAMQCGYCVPGMILTATALLGRVPNPTTGQMIEALNGNLCRCCGYPNILAAVQRAAKLLAQEKSNGRQSF